MNNKTKTQSKKNGLIFLGLILMLKAKLFSKNNDDNRTEEKEENTVFHNYQGEVDKARPEQLPKPTYWPFFMAMGLAFMGWGLLSIWIISLSGLIIFFIALIAWINILRHE